MDHLKTALVTAEQIRNWTGKDSLMAKVRSLVQHGWPVSNGQVDEQLIPFARWKDNVSSQDVCQGSDSSEGPSASLGRATPSLPWNLPDEKFGPSLCMVARDGL